MSVTKLITQLTADKALGALGGGLATASLGFGVYMNFHGPVASFGHSKDFTVFAQLTAPHGPKPEPKESVTPAPSVAPTLVAATPAQRSDELDMMATASVPVPLPPGEPNADGIFSSIKVADANADAATILIDGRTRIVHVGDSVPNAGEVLEIRPGTRPSVKTSLGFIVSNLPR